MGEVNSGKLVYDTDMQQRLWEHRSSTNQDFNNFANFFLLAESIFLATIGSLLSNRTSSGFVIYILIIMGAVLTVVWLIVQSKQRIILKEIKERCKLYLPEYLESKTERKVSKVRISNIWLLTYFVPILFFTAWLVIGIYIML